MFYPSLSRVVGIRPTENYPASGLSCHGAYQFGFLLPNLLFQLVRFSSIRTQIRFQSVSIEGQAVFAISDNFWKLYIAVIFVLSFLLSLLYLF